MTLSKQDKYLGDAAVSLYHAAEEGCVPANRDTDEEDAAFCIRIVTDYIETFHYCGVDNEEGVANYVFSVLKLDRSKA